MIVISGALVLVALVLLIIGVVGPELTFVYASIAVSLVSLVFLVIGILQRRGETAPAPETAPASAASSDEDAEGVTAVIPSQEGRGSRKVAAEPPVAETADEELETGGTVLVVEGRPRYHIDGCRYLSGKDAEEVDVLDARDEGFTPCGVCKPDDVLAQEEADLLAEQEAYDDAPTAEQPVVEVDEEEPVVEEDVPGVEVPPVRAKAPARKAATKAPAKATKAPAKATKAPAKAPATRAASATSTKAPGKAPSKAPSKAAAAAAAASPAAASATKKPGSVVVIPDRGKFHRADCRYVRDVDDAEVLSKSAASRQGYAACGVCKP